MRLGGLWRRLAVIGQVGIALVAWVDVGDGRVRAATAIEASAAAAESGTVGRTGVEARWLVGLLPSSASVDGTVPVDARLVREQVTDVPPDLSEDVIAFFDAREAARALTATVPDDAFTVTRGGLDEIRQCMAFNIAGAVLVRRLMDAGARGALPVAAMRDRIARLHAAIVNRMHFQVVPAASLESRRGGLAGAVGIEGARNRAPAAYIFTRALGDDRVPALAALLSTFSWVVAGSPGTRWRDELLRALPAVADLVARPIPPGTFWDWSRQLCRQVAFENLGPLYYLNVDVVGGAKLSLEKHLASGQPVHVALHNASARPVAGQLMAMLVSEPLESDEWSPRIDVLRNVDFRIGAAARINISLDLPRTVEAGRLYTLLLDPTSAFVPAYASFTGPRVSLETCASRAVRNARKPADSSLEHALLTYAADAASNFSYLTQEERQLGILLGRSPTLSIPGALSTLFLSAPWGNSISSTMYEGDSMPDAKRTFARLEARLRALCGRDVGKVIRADDAEYGVNASLTMKTFATDASLDLTLSRWPDPSGKAQMKVDLDIGAPGVVE